MFQNIDLEMIDLAGEIPLEEPKRQYYFIAALKKLVEA